MALPKVEDNSGQMVSAVPVAIIGPGGGGGAGDGKVEVTNFPETQAVSGPLTNAQLTAVTGTAAQTAVATDPAAAGLTVVSLLRGILAEAKTQTALLQTIATNTTPVEP